MITLIDGKGQLGDCLFGLLPKVEQKIVIYHTWDVWNKDDTDKQRAQYDKYAVFLDSLSDDVKVVFISTTSKKNNAYTHYKSEAEKITLRKAGNLVVKLPMLIGKGGCEKLKKGGGPYGKMELVSIREAAEAVIKNIRVTGWCYVYGEWVSAKLVKQLIDYGNV